MLPWLKWLPWRFIFRRIARAHGFLDPVALLLEVLGVHLPVQGFEALLAESGRLKEERA